MVISLLYVDDDIPLLDHTKQILEQTGEFSVTIATNATDSARLHAEHPFDAIIAGYQVPGMNGIALVQQLRASGDTTPFIVYVGSGSEEGEIEALMTGADYTVRKGDRPGSRHIELAHKARKAVEARRAENALRIQHTLALALTTCSTVNDAALHVLEAALQADGIDSGGVYIADSVTGDVRIVVHRGLLPETIERVSHFTAESPQVLRSRSGMPFYGRYADIRPPGRDEIRDREGVTALASIPVLHEGSLIAILNLASHADDGIPAHTQKYLEMIALQISGSLSYIQYREASRDHEERYRILAESSPDLIYIINRDDSVGYVNSHAANQLGFPVEQIIGKPRAQFFPGEVGDRQGERLHEVFKAGKSLRCGVNMYLFSNQISWQDTMLVPIRDENGEVTAVLGVSRDVTERKRAEEAALESEARFRRLIEQAPISIVLLRGRRILYANQKTLEMLRINPGYAWEDQSFLNYIAQTERHTLAMRSDNREQGEMVPDEYETIALRHDGDAFPCHVVVSKIEVPEGVITIAFLEDITERKRAESEISRLYREMEQRVSERTQELSSATREMEAFSYSVSHDLRAPLRAIDGFSGIFMERFGSLIPAEGVGYLRKVRENTVQMAALIDALLELSRLGRRELNKEVVNPAEIVTDVLGKLRHETASRKVEVITGVMPPCLADPVMLHQVYFNLLSNALKFSRGHNPAIIHIGSDTGEGQTIYYIRDNGIGFEMEHAGRLFEPFQRLHDAKRYEGTGIGLTIVRRIIERHGGKIWVESAVGDGTTFFFTIPLIPGTSMPQVR